MKRHRYSDCPTSPENTTKRFSRSELRFMIHEEVQSAVSKTDERMERLVEKIKHLESEGKCDLAIRKLEARTKKLRRRGDAVIAYFKKLGTNGIPCPKVTLPSLTPLSAGAPCSSDSEERISYMVAHLKQDPSDIDGEMTSPAFIMLDKQTSPVPPQLEQEKGQPGKADGGDDSVLKVPGDQALLLKKEPPCLSPPALSPSPPMAACPPLQGEFSIPPLPANPFPLVMNAEAASYSIPQKPTLQLALIRNPPSISALWNVETVDPAAPPMDSYSLFMAVESARGSGRFSAWASLGAVRAIPLPMCVLISKYTPGRRLCLTVVGRDAFGRYGPYSPVVHATMPA